VDKSEPKRGGADWQGSASKSGEVRTNSYLKGCRGLRRFIPKRWGTAMRNFATFAGALALVGVASIYGIGQVVAQQSFSCAYGKQASCLDYGDKVCSSFSKCVDQNAKCVDQSSTCFSSYTCNYQGFICKSKYDEVVDEYNDLSRKNKRLISEYNSLLSEHQENVDDYNRLLRKHSELETCISDADTLDEAKSCVW